MFVWLNRLPPGLSLAGDGVEPGIGTPGRPAPAVKSAAGGWLVPSTAGAVTTDDRGLLLGDGLFETMRVSGGQVPFLHRHLQRLAQGCQLLGLPPPPTDLPGAIEALLFAVGLAGARAVGPGPTPTVSPGGEGFLRLTVTRGSGPRGYAPPLAPDPLVFIQAGPWQPSQQLMTAWLAPQAYTPHPILSRVKHTSTLARVLLRDEARRRDADEAIIFNPEGFLMEGCATNLFWVRSGIVYTPDLDQGGLPGVARQFVLDTLAAAQPTTAAGGADMIVKGPVQQGAFPVRELFSAEELFLTNALQGPVAVARLLGVADGELAFDAPGPVTAALQQAWQQRLRRP